MHIRCNRLEFVTTHAPAARTMLRHMDQGHLYADSARSLSERIDILRQTPGVRVERIVSWGQCSPPGFWYDQDEDEWVALLSGSARLLLEDPDEAVALAPGDWLWIAAHRRHRVEWTAPDVASVWLAVFIEAQ